MKSVVSPSALAIALALGSALPAQAKPDEPGGAEASLELELAALRADMVRMAAQIDELEADLAQTRPETTTPSGLAVESAQTAENGSQSHEEPDDWSIEPRGRLQYDVGFTAVPEATGRSDGFGNELRRARLGVSGAVPGGFGYKFEVDFAGNDVAVTDAIASWESGATTLSVGQMNNFQSLEELTSSLHTSFIERAAFTDAFDFERRVGAAAQYSGRGLLVQAGLFTDNLDELSNRNWGADARVVANPDLGEAKLHLGASLHYADLESGSTVRYRQRPLVHFTPERFVDTGSLGAGGEFGLGVEGALVSGPFHAAAEGFWQSVDLPAAMQDPTFFGGYAELGYFLTPGDTRGYKGGKFDRTKPARPVGEGGMGSVQVNLRYDHLDLDDAGILGGTQSGYLLSLVWKPTANTMLLANYGRLAYDNAVHPTATGERSYDVDSFGVRAQIDF